MGLHIMEEKKMADLTVPILPLLLFVRKKAYGSGVGVEEGNRVRVSAGVQHVEGKSKENM